MTPADLYALFRSEVRDEAQPYLWSDTEVYSYMDDAQKMFCREGGGIADARSAITQIPVVAGEVWVDYDPRILKLRNVARASDFRDIEILNFEDLGKPSLFNNDYGQVTNNAKLTNLQGPLEAVVSGIEANKLRLINVPIVDDTLQCIVYRMPLEDITASSTEFEIDPQHHRHLLDWMKSLAHKKQDAETYDRGQSVEFGAAFMAYCDQARTERERREHKYRTVAYGGY